MSEQTLPTRYWLGEKLRQLDRGLLQDLLAATVQALQAEIPGLGEVVSFDVKHLYAWVKENNERAYVKDRYDKTQQLVGDPDCKLGVKRSTNKELPDGSTEEKKELLWGYGSGVAAATTADYGDVVLAEYTQPFNKADVTYFRPLYQRAVLALNQFPTHLAADAAYDAWYVYEAAARHHGIAAVPLRKSPKTPFARLADGTPCCPIGLPMHPTIQFNHTYWLSRPALPMSLAFSRKNGPDLRTCAIRQRQRLCQGCQLGTRRHPTRDTGSQQPTLPCALQPAHRLRAHQQPGQRVGH